MTDSTPARHDDLLILAMDHRHSLLTSVYGIDGDPTDAQLNQVEAHKLLIFEGLQSAIRDGVDAATVGVLVDELYGAEVAHRVRAAGIDLAMPIEASGHDWFTLQYGDLASDEWIEHIEAFAPDQVKILVRDNPEEDAGDRNTQQKDLARVSRAIHEHGWTLLVELLVPATSDQLDSVDGDEKRYDAEVRPRLTVAVIEQLQRAGLEPDVWKLEGLETDDAAELMVRTVQQDGRAAVRCIVLGRDAPQDRLDGWLRIAAATPGFIGFAIGRSVWEPPLERRLKGEIDDASLVDGVAANFAHFVRTWNDARESGRKGFLTPDA